MANPPQRNRIHPIRITPVLAIDPRPFLNVYRPIFTIKTDDTDEHQDEVAPMFRHVEG
jgi:hypothetical protein